MIIATLHGEPLIIDADNGMVWLESSALSHPLAYEEKQDCLSGDLARIKKAVTPYLGTAYTSQLMLPTTQVAA